MNRNEHISQLIYRHIIGRISNEELHELQEWVKESAANRKAFTQLSDPAFLEQEYRKSKAIDPQRAMADMQARIGDSMVSKKPLWRILTSRVTQIAAVVILIAGAYIYYNKVGQGTPTAEVAQTTDNAIHHGSTQAVMTLDNGEVITLGADATENKQLLSQADEYEDVREIKLSTPRGGEFKITLEDGTEVWLNAASQLRYPETFGDKERRVEVTGEAYFKVAKDAVRPFYVETAGQVVRVYGTEFNVHSYTEDKDVSTTLVEGSIALSQVSGNGSEMMLTPGHQALFDKASSATHVRSVDTSVVTSWRSGRFVFEEQTLEQIMQTLSRWYDFEYAFADSDLANMMFMGSVPRYGEFSEVLSILEKSGGLRFRQKGHTVIIKKNKN